MTLFSLAVLLIAPSTSFAGDGHPRPLSSPRWCAGAAVLEDAPVIVGGRENDRFLDDVEYLDRVTMEWNRLRPLPSARACPGVAVTAQGLFAVGGEDRAGPSASAELFDSRSREWRALPQLPSPITRAGVAARNGAIIVLGGITPKGPTSEVWVLRPGANRWEPLPPLTAARWDFPAVNGKRGIYLVGGLEGNSLAPTPTARIDEYELSGKLSVRAKLVAPRSGAAAAMRRDRLVVAGGVGQDGRALAAFDSYDFATSSWTKVCTLSHPRRHLSLAVWSAGILAAGGAADSNLGRTGYKLFNTDDGSCLEMVEPNLDAHGVAYIGPDRKEPIEIQYAQRPERANDLALVVGIRRYEALPPVPYADADAEAVAERFRALGFSTGSIKVLIDSDASLTDLTVALEGWMPRAAHPESRIYVYFSGHGAPSIGDNSAYLVPRDGDPQYVRSTALPLNKLVSRLGALNIAHAYILLDSCFSGTGDRSVITKGMRPLITIKRPPLSGKVSILAAAGGNEAAGSSDARRHGLFTYHLLNGLSGAADVNTDGRITLRELHAYLSRRVKDEARAANREQTPVLDTLSPEREF